MNQRLMELVEKDSLKTEVPEFEIGDLVEVHTKILEGEKERVQVFAGTVIARSGGGSREMFTVRRIVAGRNHHAGRGVECPRGKRHQGRGQPHRHRTRGGG